MSARTPSARARKRFVAHLAETLNVTEACKVAGFARATAYRLRSRDADFAAEWAEAEEQAIDALEAQAWEIATKGALEETRDETGRVVTTRRRQDPQMVRFLLIAHRADRFSEKRQLEVLGRVEHEIVPPPETITLGELMKRAGELEAGDGQAAEVVAEEDAET